MNLQIRNPRAYELAKKLAEKRNISMSDVVIEALEQMDRQGREQKPLWDRIQPLLEQVRKDSRPGGRDLAKDEIDALWGHE